MLYEGCNIMTENFTVVRLVTICVCWLMFSFHVTDKALTLIINQAKRTNPQFDCIGIIVGSVMLSVQ